MHIPDGYLSPQTYGTMYAAMAPLWYRAWQKVKKEFAEANLPFLGIGAAFSFIVMMFNFPVPGGSTGHIVGGALLALMFGPWAALISISVVLVIQALVFGDGGVTALAANAFNMAFVLPFSAYYLYKLIGGHAAVFRRRQKAAAFIAGWLGLTIAAATTGVMLGIQPLLAVSAQGRPLYSPYPLATAVPAMVFSHLLLFGILEGLVTMGVMVFLSRPAAEFPRPKVLAPPVKMEAEY